MQLLESFQKANMKVLGTDFNRSIKKKIKQTFNVFCSFHGNLRITALPTWPRSSSQCCSLPLQAGGAEAQAVVPAVPVTGVEYLGCVIGEASSQTCTVLQSVKYLDCVIGEASSQSCSFTEVTVKLYRTGDFPFLFY